MFPCIRVDVEHKAADASAEGAGLHDQRVPDANRRRRLFVRVPG